MKIAELLPFQTRFTSVPSNTPFLDQKTEEGRKPDFEEVSTVRIVLEVVVLGQYVFLNKLKEK